VSAWHFPSSMPSKSTELCLEQSRKLWNMQSACTICFMLSGLSLTASLFPLGQSAMYIHCMHGDSTVRYMKCMWRVLVGVHVEGAARPAICAVIYLIITLQLHTGMFAPVCM